MSNNKRQNYTLVIPVYIINQDGRSVITKENTGIFSPEKCSIKLVAETPDEALNIFQENLGKLCISNLFPKE